MIRYIVLLVLQLAILMALAYVMFEHARSGGWVLAVLVGAAIGVLYYYFTEYAFPWEDDDEKHN